MSCRIAITRFSGQYVFSWRMRASPYRAPLLETSFFDASDAVSKPFRLELAGGKVEAQQVAVVDADDAVAVAWDCEVVGVQLVAANCPTSTNIAFSSSVRSQGCTPLALANTIRPLRSILTFGRSFNETGPGVWAILSLYLSISPFMIVRLHNLARLVAVDGNLIWMQYANELGPERIHIVFSELGVCCETVHIPFEAMIERKTGGNGE